MLTHLHGSDGGDGVHMVRGRHRDGVNGLAHLVQHLAVVLECGSSGIFFATSPKCVQIHVAQCDNVATATRVVIRVTAALAACADGSDIDFAV